MVALWGGLFLMSEVPLWVSTRTPLSSEYGAYTAVKARFWP